MTDQPTGFINPNAELRAILRLISPVSKAVSYLKAMMHDIDSGELLEEDDFHILKDYILDMTWLTPEARNEAIKRVDYIVSGPRIQEENCG